MKALHMVQREDVAGLTGLDLTPFDLFICNPAMSLSVVTNARDAKRIKMDALFFGSTNCHMLGYWTNSIYYSSLLTALNRHLLLDKKGDVVFHNKHNAVYLYPTTTMYREYAEWLYEHDKYPPYLDDCTKDYPNSKWRDVQPHLTNMTYDQWNSLYKDGMAAFQGRLHQLYGNLSDAAESAPVIANTAGTIFPYLNGICIERNHHRYTLGGSVLALARFAIQYTRGKKPCYNIDWYGNWELPPMIIKGVGIDSLRQKKDVD